MSFEEFVGLAILTAQSDVGPWVSGAAETAASAYRDAGARVPIAEAVSDRFGELLHAPSIPDLQQWWTTPVTCDDRSVPLFDSFEHVYGAGQFTWAGLWTVTEPPAVLHARLVDVWEMYPGPISRWRLPVRPRARVLEVHRPDDWVRLVIAHPQQATSHPEHRELPSTNQEPASLRSLTAVPGQRAARASLRHHLVPDWWSVSEHYDGVHLSWAGLIAAEGCITDLGRGDVAMLRYWSSERTLWLADVFGEPEPAPPPALPHRSESDDTVAGVNLRTDPDRLHIDVEALANLLGR